MGIRGKDVAVTLSHGELWEHPTQREDLLQLPFAEHPPEDGEQGPREKQGDPL